MNFRAQGEKSASWRGREMERWVSLELLKHGYNCAEPLVDLGADLWVETLGGIVKAQVKTAYRPNKGSEAWRLLGGSSKTQARRRDGSDARTFSDYRARGVGVVFVLRPDFGGCWIVPMAAIRVERTVTLGAQFWERWDLLGQPMQRDRQVAEAAQMVLAP